MGCDQRRKGAPLASVTAMGRKAGDRPAAAQRRAPSTWGAPNTPASRAQGRLSPPEALGGARSLRLERRKDQGAFGGPRPSPRRTHRGFTQGPAWARPPRAQSPERGGSHAMSNGFCRPCNPSTRRTSLSEPISSARLQGLPRCHGRGRVAARSREGAHRPSLRSLGGRLAPWALRPPPQRPLALVALPQPASLEHPLSQAEPPQRWTPLWGGRAVSGS